MFAAVGRMLQPVGPTGVTPLSGRSALAPRTTPLENRALLLAATGFSLLVLAGCGGAPPTSSFTIESNPTEEDAPVRFDGSASDPGEKAENCYASDEITRYDWDLDGDGTFEIQGKSSTAARRYVSPREVQVSLRVTNSCDASDVSSVPVVVTARAPEPPEDPPPPPGPPTDEQPRISGTPQDGEVLRISAPATKANQNDLSYLWLRCDTAGGACINIPDALDEYYLVYSADVRSTIRVRVTTSTGEQTSTTTSEPTSLVQAVGPAADGPPQVEGDLMTGAVLSASEGLWRGTKPLTHAYQWERCNPDTSICTDIPGATRSSYQIESTDIASSVRVRLTTSNSAGTGTARSLRSEPISGAVVVPGAQPPPPVTPLTDADRLAQHRQFRQDFGLRTDEPYIASQLNAEPSPVYGVPLSSDEEHILDSRDLVERALSSVDDYGRRTASDAYADLYVNQGDRGNVYVGFTDNATTHLDALRKLFPYPSKLRTFVARYTRTELLELQDRVAGDFEALEAEGLDVRTVSVDVEGNRVEVGVPAPTQLLADRLARRYGPAIDLIEADPVAAQRNQDQTPLKAGLQIYPGPDEASTVVYCTSGFVAEKPTDIAGAPGFNFYLFTAGHCVNDGEDWFQSGNKIGEVVKKNFKSGSAVDGGLISIGSEITGVTRNTKKSNYVYLRHGIVQSITRVQSESRNKTGTKVCMSAVASDNACGKVKRQSVDARVGDVRLKGQRQASFACRAGDSGGPIFFRRVAIGIAVAYLRKGNDCLYSHIGHAENILDVRVRTRDDGNLGG